MNDLVSIITPAYNCEKYIAQTIESVLVQTYKNWEMLICDDGSTDATGRIADDYAAKDRRIRVVHQPNSGLPAAARNSAGRMATGGFIAFLDGDDLWLPQKLEKQLAFLNSHPEFEAVHTSFALTGEPEVVAFYKKFWETYNHEKATFEMMIMKCVMHISTLMVRKICFDALQGFDEDLRLRGVEDYDYMLRLAARAPVYHICENLSFYRIVKGSISHNNQYNLHEKTQYLFNKLLTKGIQIEPSQLRRKQARITYSRGIDLLYTVTEPYRHYFWQAFKSDCFNIQFLITLISSILPRPLLKKWLSFLLAIKNRF
ncbi:MAG TPA: glycosyltransferase family A protein [Candidatus Sumerlaeia bacterium]|nr:glycosyltransferase family A protein [Candidatus Sumerlaeia bacterium]